MDKEEGDKKRFFLTTDPKVRDDLAVHLLTDADAALDQPLGLLQHDTVTQ